MIKYFKPPFYLCDTNVNKMYNMANNRMEEICNFDYKPVRNLTDKELSKLNNKLLELKYGTINT